MKYLIILFLISCGKTSVDDGFYETTSPSDGNTGLEQTIPCRSGFVKLENVCVMQYEASYTTELESSNANYKTNITITEAENLCKAMGLNYHLMSNFLWNKIAYQIYNNPANYTSCLSRGNIGLNTACSKDTSLQDNQVFHMDNGIIYDFSGGLEEFVSLDNSLEKSFNSSCYHGWSSFDSICDDDITNLSIPWEEEFGKAMISSGKVIVRGGSKSIGTNSGIFSFRTISNTFTSPNIGFRCYYTN